jgi:Uma2 family endonuclease
MPPTLTVPVEEYLRTSYQPDREYVRGQLLERHVGEYFHSWMQNLLLVLLNERNRDRRYRVFPEQRVRISSEPRYRVPDICVKALPHEITPVLESPDLVVEVMSPDDTFPEMLEKAADYLKTGTTQIWIVNPYKREVHIADLDGVTRQDHVENPLTGPVDFKELFAALG